jgi:hypothetical protein
MSDTTGTAASPHLHDTSAGNIACMAFNRGVVLEARLADALARIEALERKVAELETKGRHRI